MLPILEENDFNALQHMEKTFHDAVYSGFMRIASTSDIDFLRSIWPKYNNDLSVVRGRCDSCTLHVVTFIGQLYFRTKGLMNQNKEIPCKQEKSQQNALEVLELPKPKPQQKAQPKAPKKPKKPQQKGKKATKEKASSRAVSSQVK